MKKYLFKCAFIGIVLAFILSVFVGCNSRHQHSNSVPEQEEVKINEILGPPFFSTDQTWADSVFNTLSLEERIAQLIMIPVYSNRSNKHIDSISSLVKKYKIGGMIFFQGGPVRQAKMVNRYQEESKIPLMISIDGEWGLGMRLDSTMSFPYQMALGGIEDENLIYEMGVEIGKQCRRLGVQVNFAPSIDINNNPDNPVIGFRSFGEDKFNVARKAMAYMKGLQDQNILASAKHFPGHGDTNVDSHYGLPTITFSRERLDSLELYPFRELINQGLGSIMVAHMNIPALDSTHNLASTLSKPIVSGLLKGELAYKGIVFTDALNMKGVAKYYPPGIVDVKALLAGNDILLNTMDVKTTIEEVKKAIENNEISQEEIDGRCKKILAAKQWMGLNEWKPVEMESLITDLNNPTANLLNRKLVDASLTLLENKDSILPLKPRSEKKIAAVAIGSLKETVFQRQLENFTKVDKFYLKSKCTPAEIRALQSALKSYDIVIVGVHNLQLKAISGTFGVTPQMNSFLKGLITEKPTVIGMFSNVYSLAKFDGLENSHALIAAYQESIITQEAVADMIFGKIGAKGKLPVTVSEVFKIGNGLKTVKSFEEQETDEI